MRRDLDEEIDGRSCCSAGADAARIHNGRCRNRLLQVEGLLEAREIVPRFDEFVEEVVICGRVWQESITGRDGESQAGEQRVKQGAEVGVEGNKVLGVGSEESKKGEKSLPKKRPVVLEPGPGEDEVCEEPMDQPEAGNVEGDIEAAAEVVVDCVDQDVEDRSRGWTGIRSRGEKGRLLTAESDGEGGFGAAQMFAKDRVLDGEAERCEVKEAVKGGAGGAMGVMEDIGC